MHVGTSKDHPSWFRDKCQPKFMVSLFLIFVSQNYSQMKCQRSPGENTCQPADTIFVLFPCGIPAGTFSARYSRWKSVWRDVSCLHSFASPAGPSQLLSPHWGYRFLVLSHRSSVAWRVSSKDREYRFSISISPKPRFKENEALVRSTMWLRCSSDLFLAVWMRVPWSSLTAGTQQAFFPTR